MQLNLTGRHLELTDAIKTYVKDKFKKLEQHSSDISQVQVTLTVEKLAQKAEANVHLKGTELHANAESENLYAAIDGLIDKLDRQLLKHKEKMVKHRA